MKFPSKITLITVLALLLGATAGAHAFIAPGVTPKILDVQNINEMAYRANALRLMQSSADLLVPAARPVHPDFSNRAEKLFERSA